MGLFDDILGKATELTGMGQDAADSASQMTEEGTARVEEQATNLTENVPQDVTDAASQFFGDSNNEN
jgi:chemotaxis response regulator CheB